MTTEEMEQKLIDAGWFLRDDREATLREDEAYSLFKKDPYQRHAVYAGSREWAVQKAYEEVFK